MSYTSHYVDGGKGVHKIGKGVITSADFLLVALEQARDVKGASQLKYALGDFSEATEFQITIDSLRQLVEVQRKTAQLSSGAFIAIIAPSQQPYGLSRVWQSFTEDMGWSASVFRNRTEAILWLRTQLGKGDPHAALLNEFPSLKLDQDL
jgi:hypothetical protein